MKNKNRVFQHNGKEFVFVDTYNDEKYGEIVKAITTKLEDFEQIYYKNDKGHLSLIEDEETLKYIYETYERMVSDIILDD